MSKNGRRVPRAEALAVAEQVVEEIRPWCDRVEVAGSVRRLRPDVGDIDIVCQPSLWWEDVFVKGALIEKGARFESVAAESWAFALNGLKVELCLAVPETYPMKVLWRTGSWQHNAMLASRAMRMGLRMRKAGVVEAATGEVLAWETEEAIFEALGLEWVPPERRES